VEAARIIETLRKMLPPLTTANGLVPEPSQNILLLRDTERASILFSSISLHDPRDLRKIFGRLSGTENTHKLEEIARSDTLRGCSDCQTTLQQQHTIGFRTVTN